jgi:hypothetical protein
MMGPSFLTPAFFVGLVALAIPVLIHLTHREKREIVEFPSLMFLRKIPYRSVRRQRIRHLLLFLMRSLALLLLVVAFTRPFWERSGQASASLGGAREVVLLLDHSYSMGYGDRWARALEAVHGAIDTIGSEERATLIIFSNRAEALNQPTSDRNQLHALVEGLRVGSGTTRYAPALEVARKVLEESNRPEREVVLITDYQKAGWEGQEDVELPVGTTLTGIDLSDEETSNLSVTSVVLEREYLQGRERIVASARLTNKGTKPYDDVRVQLELGSRRLQDERVSIEANSSATVTFEPFILPEGISRGQVSVESDALPQDNLFHFVLWPGQSLSVLVLEGSSGTRQSFYLRRALTLGNRPTFGVDVKPFARLRGEDLTRRSLVILNDTPPPNEPAGRRLVDYVEAGGGLVVILGERSGTAGWTGPAAELVPGPWGAPVDRSKDWGGTLSYIDYSHPIFELFSAPRSGDFSTAKFFRYRRLATLGDDRVLARFDDGSVALAEKRVGEGKVLVWASTLDTFWNDFAVQPVYLPFVHQFAQYASGYAEAEHWHNVGDVLEIGRYLDVAGASISLPADFEDGAQSGLVVLKPSGEKSFLSQEDGRTLLTLEEQGFYDIRVAESQSAQPLSLAVNLDLTESDLSSLDPEELEAAVAFRGEPSAGESRVKWTPEDQEGRQSVWWFFLVAALLLLAAETIFSNRLSLTAR